MTRYLVFGATGHIGGPCATALCAQVGADAVKVASHRADGVAQLREAFPGSQALQLDMMSAASLRDALADVAAVFIVTPDFFDDEAGALALVEACGGLAAPPHVVRVQAEIPGLGKDDLTGLLANRIGRRGHIVAREIFSESPLPASFLNVLGYYMDDLSIHFGEGVRQSDTLLVPYDRPMCWIDPADLGEAAARVMLAAPPVGSQTLHLNSGAAPLLFSELAALLSAKLSREIQYADDEDGFRKMVGPALVDFTGDKNAAEYLLADWRSERRHADAYRGTPYLAQLLGKTPTQLADWIASNQQTLT